jgi:hypothetical protein
MDKHLSSQNSLLFYKGHCNIPNDQHPWLMIMEYLCDSRIAGHFGQFKRSERIKALCYWLKNNNDVDKYVWSCLPYQKRKASKHKKSDLLQPLEIPIHPWIAISKDFITGLPQSSGFTGVLIIIDRFTTMAHFIPLKTEAAIEEFACMFLQEVWRLHGLPSKIVSDRDAHFESKFWDLVKK